MRKEIFRTTKIPRNKFLDEEKSQGRDNEVTINVTYYPVFKHVKSQLKKLHITLACDEDHKNLFLDEPVIDFKNNKNLK